MQRSQGNSNRASVATLLFLGASLILVPAAGAASGGKPGADRSPAVPAGLSSIGGVVRDSQGVAQMGALVQVLAANSITVATAFTDQHGRYLIANLNPGRYLVRASATLFVPVTRSNLQLRNGATAIVNLTLAALFDTTSWLPAQRRRADETEDDWKWTLRSTANRPILRIVEDGTEIEVSSSAEEQRPALRVKAQEAIESSDGSFGNGGLHNIVTVHEGLDDGADVMLRADLGMSPHAPSDMAGASSPGATGLAGSEFDAGYEARTGFNGGAARTVISYKSHPELVGAGFSSGLAGGAGLQVLEISSVQRLSLGERVEVEAGGRMEAVRTAATALATHPLLRVSAHPGGEWTIEYRMASDRGLQEFDDVTSGDSDVPVALMKDGRLQLESGLHQEFGAGKNARAGSFQIAYYADRFNQAAISGGEAGLSPTSTAAAGVAGELVPFAVPVGILLDPTTGSFRALGMGYGSEGIRITASSALTPSLWLAAEYSTGEALATRGEDGMVAPVGIEQALAALRVKRSETATIALKGKVLNTGTRVRASYRWQPASGVTAVDAYSAFGDQAYLSCLLRQPIRAGALLPQGLEATIDVTNLLAQGYRPFLSADGQTLYFAQAPRTVQAGLSFSF